MPFGDDFLLDPAVAFLNHGSFGACPIPVLEAQDELRRELEREPVAFLARSLDDRLAAVRRGLASYIGAADPDAIVLSGSVTHGLNAVAASVPLEPGDEILMTAHEYPSTITMWREIATRAGARAVVVPPAWPAVRGDTVARLESAVTSRTRVVFCSHVTSETATLLPVEDVVQIAHRAGAISIVDGAHAPGHIPVDVDSIGADVYAVNAHKWLCAPKGSAFLHVAQTAQEWVRPLVITSRWNDSVPTSFQARFSWPGTYDPTPALSIPAAVEYQAERDWGRVRRGCADLGRATVAEIEQRGLGRRCTPEELTPPQMVAFSVAHPDPHRLQAELWDEYRIEIPAWPVDGVATVRLSVQAYTSEEHCERLIDALAALLGRAGNC